MFDAFRTRTRAALTGAGIVLSTFVLAAAPAAAGVKPDSHPPGAGTPAPTGGGEQCRLRNPQQPNDEFGKCLTVRVSASRAPAVGEDTTITVVVNAAATRKDATLRVDAPAGMRFVDAPGAAITGGRVANGVASASRASLRTALAANASQTHSFVVHADKAGVRQVRVSVSAPAPGGTDGAAGSVFLTIGKDAASSRIGAAPAPTNGGTATVAAGTAITPTPTARHDVAKPIAATPAQDEAAPASVQAAPSGQSCAVGGWFFVDNTGATRAAFNESVEAWDHDTFSGDDLLASGVIAENGSYRLCFNNDDGDPFDDSTQEVYVRFITSNSQWRVRDTASGNNNYVFTTETVDVCDTCEQNYGNRQPSDNAVMRGLHAFSALNDLWQKVHGANGCFDRNDGSCRQMVLNWTSTSGDGTYYSRDGNDIHLAADDPNAHTTVVHEGSHALMDDVYEDALPVTTNCNPHSIIGITSQTCAWVEGFAEWLPAQVYNDPFFRWPDGTSRDLESPTWNTSPWSNGDSVEGRVAGAMIDISDGNNEAPWDYASEGFNNQYTTFVNTISNTFNEFITVDRPAQGFEFNDGGSRGSTFQNSIDYDFRNPLFSQVEKVLPIPNPAQNSVFNTSRAYWSVIADRPASGDYDLALYDNRNLTGFLAGSTQSASTIDWVAIDGNRRAGGDYYPQSYVYTGGAGHNVEFSETAETVGDGSAVYSFGSNDVVRSLDSLVTANVPTYFRIVPSGGLNIEAFLARSDAANANTWVQGRGSAVRAVNAGGFGGEESFNYTDPVGQWDGLIVTNVGGSGTITVYRDTTAPTGSVTIGAGNPASTNTRNVTLQLPASDSQTGVYQMRIAVDGVIDTEPWQAYAATKAVTLPDGAGTKTVAVQFRNAALMNSTTYVDTIQYAPK